MLGFGSSSPTLDLAIATVIAFGFGMLAQPARGQGAPAGPDLIVHNARVLTMDPARPEASAFAVWQGRYLLVGGDAEVLGTRIPATRIWDAGRKTIVPGFNDSHLHPRPEFAEESIHAEVELGPSRIRAMSELVAALRGKASRVPAGQWVLGTNYEDTKLGGHPTREVLDSVSTNHPILLRHSSGHIWAVNSVVLRAARITSSTPDPSGGGFGRTADGEPDGVLREPPALALVQASGPKQATPSRAELLQGYRRCLERFAAAGITSLTDAAGTPERLGMYQELVRGARLPRINVLMQDAFLDAVIAAGMRSGFGNEWVRLVGIKIVHGNSLSGRTCWLSEPYDRVDPATGRRDYYGIPPRRTQDELDGLVAKVHAAGLQPAIHANGDREIAMVLDAFEKALTAAPRSDARMRIEHASVCPEPLLRRAQKLGVVLALHSYVYEHGDKMEEYGSWRWDQMHPNRSADALGIVVAANSDWPVSAALPLRRIQSLVTRESAGGKVYGPSQRVPVETALRFWTTGGAYASFEESSKGNIGPGKFADFVVLAANPCSVDAKSIQHIAVEATFIGGTQVHPAPIDGRH